MKEFSRENGAFAGPRARSVGLVVAGFLFLLPSPSARADEPEAEPEVHWSAPPDCPTLADFLAEVDRLRQQPRPRSGAGTQITAEVTRDSDAARLYRLRLVFADRGGEVRERRIEGETCAEVTGAAAVVLALSSDSLASDSAAGAGTAPATAASPIPSIPPEDPPSPGELPGDDSPSEEASPLPPRIWGLSAIGGVDFTSLPSPAPGFGLGISLSVGEHLLELRATAWLPEKALVGTDPSVGLNMSLYTGALRYCRSLFEGRLDLAPCAGVEAGAMVASGVGLRVPSQGEGPWFAPGLGLRGSLRLTSRVGLSLGVEGFAPLAKPRFVIDFAGQVYQPPSVTARTLAGFHVRFP